LARGFERVWRRSEMKRNGKTSNRSILGIDFQAVQSQFKSVSRLSVIGKVTVGAKFRMCFSIRIRRIDPIREIKTHRIPTSLERAHEEELRSRLDYDF